MKINKSAILALALSMSFVVTNTALAAEENVDSASETASVAENSIGGGKGLQELESETPEEPTTTPLEENEEGANEKADLELNEEDPELEISEDEEHVDLTAVPPTNEEGTTEEEFSKAVDPLFKNVKNKDGVYEGKYDKDKKEVTVNILNKEKSFAELSGTGLIDGLTALYKNNNLVKLQVGDQEVRDLLAIGKASTDDANLMVNFKQIIGLDIANQIAGKGGKINNLGDFVGKDVVLKLTIKDKDGKEIPLEYHIKGVINHDSYPDVCPLPDALEKEFSENVDKKFDSISTKEGTYEGSYDKEKKEITVKILDETKGIKELSGTGLIKGLTDLYENNNLVKVKIGNQDERDLVEIAKAMGNDKAQLMQALAQIVGADIGNAIDNSGASIKLGTFIGKELPIKLTVKKPECEEEKTLTYILKGVDKNGKVPGSDDDKKPNPDQKPQPKPEDKPTDKDDDDFDFGYFFPGIIGGEDESKKDPTENKEEKEDDKKVEEKDNKEDNKSEEENKEKDNKEEKPSDKKENKENEAKKDTNKQASAPAKSNNPKTGVASLGYLAGLSAVSMAGIIVSRKKENK